MQGDSKLFAVRRAASPNTATDIVVDHRNRVESAPAEITFGRSRRLAYRFFLSFAGLFCLAVCLQLLSGAYHSELSGHPDEPPHFTTGLMIRDYIAAGFPRNPIEFAENYYLHYPKVALGHWPPVFYVLEALWFLVFPPSKTAALILVALYATACAAVLGQWLADRHSQAAGTLTAVLFLCMPAVQRQTSMVMLEMLLTLLGLLAAIWFGKFLEDGRLRSSMGFGVCAALDILVKGNGWALVLLPPIALLLTRRFRLLASWRLWASTIPVAILCIPWQLRTLHMAEQGFAEIPVPVFFFNSMKDFTLIRFPEFNGVLVLFCLAGVFAKLAQRRMESGFAAMLALFLASLLFHSLVPTGNELRKLLLGLPGLLAFLPSGVYAIADRLGRWNFTILNRPSVLASLVGLSFVSGTFAIPQKTSYGFEQAAQWLVSRPDLRDAVILVSSNADGEGLAITETEVRESRPGHFITRATKLLASMDWSGYHYRARFQTSDQVERELDRIPVSLLWIDFRPQGPARTDFVQLLKSIREHPEIWRLAGSFHAPGENVNAVRIYERIAGSKERRGSIRVDMTTELGRVLEE